MNEQGQIPDLILQLIYSDQDKLSQFSELIRPYLNNGVQFNPIMCDDDLDIGSLSITGVTFIEGSVIRKKKACDKFQELLENISSRIILLVDRAEEEGALKFIAQGADTYFFWDNLKNEDIGRIIKVSKAKGSRIERNSNNILDSFYLKKIFDRAKEAIAVIDTDYRYIKVNKAYLDLFGYSEEYLMSRTPAVIIGEKRLQKNMEFIKQNNIALQKEVEIINAAGKKLFVELSIFPITNWKDETIAYVGINRDRTEEREIQSMLKLSEDRFERAFEASPDAMAISRLSDGLYIDINEGFTRLTGYSKEELIGKSTYDISLWYSREERKKLIEKLQESDYVKDIEVRFRREDGMIRTGTMSANILEFNNEKYLLSITRDITDWLDIQEALVKSESNLKKAQEIAHLGSWELDVESGIISFSEEAGKTLSMPLTSLIIRLSKLPDIINRSTGEAFISLIEKNLKMIRKNFESELKLYKPKGGLRYGYVIGEVHRNQNNEVITVNGAIQDITDAVKAKEQIEESEYALRQFAENTSDKITRTDLNGRIIQALGPIKELIGYTQEEFLGTLIFEYIHPDDLNYVIESFKKAMGQKVKGIEYRFRHKNGNYLWVESRGNAVFDKDGKAIGLVSGTTIIHEQKLAQQKLEESEEKHRLLIENNFDLVVEVDAKGHFIYISKNVEQLLGYAQEDIVGKHYKEFTHPLAQKDAKAFFEKDFSDFNIRYKHKNGDWRWFETAARNYKNLNGDTITLIISKDITERMIYEQALAGSEQKFRSLTENSLDIIMRFDRRHHILYSNSAGKAWFDGATNKNLVHISKTLLTKDILRDMKLCIELVFSTGEKQRMQFSIELEGVKKSYDWQGVPEFSSKKKVDSVLGVARDLTAFMQTQDELNKLHQVIEHSTNSVIITDENGIIEHVNPRTLEVTGYEYHEIIGENPRVLKSGHTPQEVYKELWDTISSGKTWKGEFHNKKKNGDLYWEFAIISPIKNNEGEIVNYLAIKEDITHQKESEEIIRQSKETLAMTLEANQIGTWSWILDSNEYILDKQSINILGLSLHKENTFHPDHIAEFIHPEDRNMIDTKVYKSLKKGDTMDIDFRILDKKDRIKHLIMKSRITRNKDGRVKRMDGICMDVTDIRKTEDTLKIRNEELNQFVYKVSHDLRAPLASIRGIIELEKIQNKNRPTIKHLSLIEERVLILDEFIRNILSHSRNLNTQISYSKIDLESIIEECYKELEFLNNALSIKQITKVSGIDFYSDESRVYEIFRNLISNGIKYIDYKKSEPFIKISVKISKKECLIEIEDNGIGIHQQFKEKVFNMFFRAHERSEGSGIGLYIVKLAVEKLSGVISMDSKYGEGTIFKIKLPNNKKEN